MPVRCADCGEELMGSVNRCWRCGRTFAFHPSSVPPLRRAPLVGPLDGAAEALVLNEVAEDDADPAARQGTPAITEEQRWQRRGSPFAQASATSSEPLVPSREPAIPDYPNHPGATGAAAAAIVLAVIAFGLALPFPAGALVLGLAGLGLGCLALPGRRRKVAIFSLVLCCVAFTCAAFVSALSYYQSFRGPVMPPAVNVPP